MPAENQAVQPKLPRSGPSRPNLTMHGSKKLGFMLLGLGSGQIGLAVGRPDEINAYG